MLCLNQIYHHHAEGTLMVVEADSNPDNNWKYSNKEFQKYHGIHMNMGWNGYIIIT